MEMVNEATLGVVASRLMREALGGELAERRYLLSQCQKVLHT